MLAFNFKTDFGVDAQVGELTPFRKAVKIDAVVKMDEMHGRYIGKALFIHSAKMPHMGLVQKGNYLIRRELVFFHARLHALSFDLE